ncbi:2-keto-4-pentenoate hydratase [Tsukamurella spumae]|uniref:2-keto-4-pentenoate hydratase n=1 Tax=Tsukamurella spumae TaxID=44753 RepID=A0A846WZI9_9ACTN|nr:2-keto-4-pentenoate hydratase [Tsukamurella spumae]NKY18384.1 2-keto-4-pentenoate hydratase [Tsukamurella spumae]
MDDSAISAAADALLGAYAARTPIGPIIERFPEATITDAYRIQQEQVRRWEADGDLVKGHKVGLASPAMQRQMNVYEPDFGHLTASMFHLEQLPIDTSSWMQPRIEPEIAFVLGRELSGPGVTVADAIRAVDFVVPALEVVDSRITDWNISIVDTVADNASSGGVILGSRPTRLHDIDLRTVGCTFRISGEQVGTGAGGAVLGSPINALVWLANTVGPLGTVLRPGHVVLPGSMTRAEPVRAGDVVVADMGPLGSVTAVLAA